MSFIKKNSGLTKRTQKILLAGENQKVDFKLNPNGVHIDDLVAFANTEMGGEIILGVDERKNEDGSQYGVPKGCEPSDEVALQILNKAVTAIPPISVKLFAENTSHHPIVRIVIPTSDNKPHCTPKGVYLRRDGSRNRPIHPPELLKIFLDSESRAFSERFEDAAETITHQLIELQDSLTSSVDGMASQLGWVDSQLGDTESAMQSAAAYAKLGHEEATFISDRLRTLFRQDERDDPVHNKVRADFLESIVSQLQEDPALIETAKENRSSIQLSAKGRAAKELTKTDLEVIFKEAFKQVTGFEIDLEKR